MSSYLEAAAAMGGGDASRRAAVAGDEAFTDCFVLSRRRVVGVGDFSAGACFLVKRFDILL